MEDKKFKYPKVAGAECGDIDDRWIKCESPLQCCENKTYGYYNSQYSLAKFSKYDHACDYMESCYIKHHPEIRLRTSGVVAIVLLVSCFICCSCFVIRKVYAIR